jgi:hypothetical protein
MFCVLSSWCALSLRMPGPTRPERRQTACDRSCVQGTPFLAAKVRRGGVRWSERMTAAPTGERVASLATESTRGPRWREDDPTSARTVLARLGRSSEARRRTCPRRRRPVRSRVVGSDLLLLVRSAGSSVRRISGPPDARGGLVAHRKFSEAAHFLWTSCSRTLSRKSPRM